MTILIAGGTGCVGRALARQAVERGEQIRLLSRRAPQQLRNNNALVEHIQGDVSDARVAERACAGVRVAYYLIHSLDARDQRTAEARAAAGFARAAAAARIQRIVYLGALGPDGESRSGSTHLDSRLHTGKLLRDSGIPLVELRASVLLAPGSAVFDLLGDLTERLPVVVVPHGAEQRCQPIALRDALRWLTAAASDPRFPGEPIEVGGPDIVSYLELMQAYAELRGLPRRFVRMPLATPRLSGLWIGAFSRISARAGEALVRGLTHESIVRSGRARALRDSLGADSLWSFREALQVALRGVHAAPAVIHQESSRVEPDLS